MNLVDGLNPGLPYKRDGVAAVWGPAGTITVTVSRPGGGLNVSWTVVSSSRRLAEMLYQKCQFPH